MAIRRWTSLLVMLVVACGSEPAERARPPSPPAPLRDATVRPEARVVAIGDVSIRSPDVRRALDPEGFEPPSPQAGDWMVEHPEPAQSFDDYIAAVANVPTDQRKVIYLLPIGTFPAHAPPLDALAQVVRAYFTLEVRVLPAVPLADVKATTRIHDGTRKRQLLAPEVLAWLVPRVPADAYALMALTMEDLYPDPDWNFVFGMASLDKRVGVQSFARQDPAFFGEPRGADARPLALRRATWTVVHEIAHMFGLAHCPYYRCVVAGANHQQEADRSPLHACPVCTHKLWWAIRFDPAAREAALATVLGELGIADEAEWSARRARWIRDGVR